MTDCNGVNIEIGRKVCIIHHSELRGRIGYMRAMVPRVPWSGKPHLRVADAPVDMPEFSTWVMPHKVCVVDWKLLGEP